MAPKNMALENGLYAASLTPLGPDLSIDLDTLVEHWHELQQRGCHGVVAFGSTGEGASFSLKEKLDTLEALSKRKVDFQKVIVGCHASAITEAIELCQVSSKLGSSAQLVTPPYFFKNVAEDGLFAYFSHLIQQVPTSKIILYHFPQLTGIPFTLPLVQRLHTAFPDNIVGLKESDGNFAFTQTLLTTLKGFKVYVGSEVQLAEAVRLGAAGAISGLANLYPELLRSLYEHGRDPTQPSRQQELVAIKERFSSGNIFSNIKQAQYLLKGPRWQLMRPPLMH